MAEAKNAVLVSGGGTNLQAIIDAVNSGVITNTEIKTVISNNKNAYALERANNAGIASMCISPKDYETREEVLKVAQAMARTARGAANHQWKENTTAMALAAIIAKIAFLIQPAICINAISTPE